MLEHFTEYYRHQPFPDQFKSLFEADRKSDVVSLGKQLAITKAELVTATLTCDQYGYIHWMNYGDHLPDHLKLSDEEKNALQANGVGPLIPTGGKAITKISETFKQRNYQVGHFFFRSDRWHIFFMNQRDIQKEDNHYIAGAHLHFVNFLWPSLDFDKTWQRFWELDLGFSHQVHIKFDHKSPMPPELDPSRA